MKNRLSLIRVFGFRLLGLSVTTFFFLSFARGQSIDDVHISPGSSPDNIANSSPAKEMPPPVPPSKPLHVNVDVVLVPVTVRDSNNRSVTTLNKQDFALYEEDKRQEIRYFSAEESPLSIAILVDISKSMSDKIDTERAAIAEFFKNANPDDEYFAITFSGRPHLLAKSTRSLEELERKLIAVEPGGPTAMLDAVYLAVSALRSARYERKAIVLFSDGGDNVSHYTLREIKSLVQESDLQIYAIGLFETFFLGTIEEKLGRKWLSEITDASGGRTITVDNRTKLPQAAGELSREMRNQYVLGYRPETARVSRWRKIRVWVTEPVTERRLRAYYRKGYISAGKAQPQN